MDNKERKNNMSVFENPEIKVETIGVEDVITTSDPNATPWN